MKLINHKHIEKINEQIRFKLGRARTIKRFAFFPVQLTNGDVIFFERYLIDQKYHATADSYTHRLIQANWFETKKYQI